MPDTNPKIRAALQAYTDATDDSLNIDGALIWDVLWSILDLCDENEIDFEDTFKKVRSERNRILAKKAAQDAEDENSSSARMQEIDAGLDFLGGALKDLNKTAQQMAQYVKQRADEIEQELEKLRRLR